MIAGYGETAGLFVDSNIDFIRQFYHDWSTTSSPTAKTKTKLL